MKKANIGITEKTKRQLPTSYQKFWLMSLYYIPNSCTLIGI